MHPSSSLPSEKILRRMFQYDFIATWQILVSELLEAQLFEAKIYLDEFRQRRLFP